MISKNSCRERLPILPLILAGFVLAAYSSSAQAIPVAPSAPREVITAKQLKTFLTETGSFEAQKSDVKGMLHAHYKTLPGWFPASLWSEVDIRVESANFVDASLPVYRRYLTREQMDQLNLFFKGANTGTVAHLGAPSVDVHAVIANRLSEMDVSRRKDVSEAIAAYRRVQSLIAQDLMSAHEVAYARAMQEVTTMHYPEYTMAAHPELQRIPITHSAIN